MYCIRNLKVLKNYIPWKNRTSSFKDDELMSYHNYHSGAIFMVYYLFVCNIIMKYQRPSQHETLNQCQLNVGTPSASWPNIESTLVKRYRV